MTPRRPYRIDFPQQYAPDREHGDHARPHLRGPMQRPPELPGLYCAGLVSGFFPTTVAFGFQKAGSAFTQESGG
jgi:hypothetical protein